jgi:hypothetical protein
MSSIRKYLPGLLKTVLLAYSVIALQATAYAQSCGCEVSDRKERAYDEMQGSTPMRRRKLKISISPSAFHKVQPTLPMSTFFTKMNT